ncbi:MAG: hypothetical protein HND53_11865 [Proteobacteria bacterium]|nr:hypothetical protein [Pseudomonadota bacterium]NOG61190.1 hypothetical protein [Pseudomonadota bacterium]
MFEHILKGFNFVINLISDNTIPSLIILGWMVFIWNSNRILYRAEKKTLIDKSIKILEGISNEGYKFWTNAKDINRQSESSEIELKQRNRTSLRKFLHDIARLESYVTLLTDRNINTLSSKEISDLKISLTFKMEDAHSFNQIDRHKIINKFLSNVSDCSEIMENSYIKAHNRYSTFIEIFCQIKDIFSCIFKFILERYIYIIVFIISIFLLDYLIG